MIAEERMVYTSSVFDRCRQINSFCGQLTYMSADKPAEIRPTPMMHLMWLCVWKMTSKVRRRRLTSVRPAAAVKMTSSAPYHDVVNKQPFTTSLGRYSTCLFRGGHSGHTRSTAMILICHYAPAQGAFRDDAVWCLTSVTYIRSACGLCGQPAAWRVLADRARLGRPGSRLPLRASVAGLGGGISWRPPAYSLLISPSCASFFTRSPN